MDRLLDIMRRLRAPDGCPWDRKQTHDSLRPYLLEEACEAIDAIATGDPAAMTEELGDVLLQVAFHAVIAEEAGSFSYEAIEGGIVDKLVRRHPHVFGTVQADTAEDVYRNWQALKAEEKGAPSEVPQSLPALMRYQELAKKRDWQARESATALAQLNSPAPASAAEAEAAIAAMLMAVADTARRWDVNAELALREAVRNKELEKDAGGAKG